MNSFLEEFNNRRKKERNSSAGNFLETRNKVEEERFADKGLSFVENHADCQQNISNRLGVSLNEGSDIQSNINSADIIKCPYLRREKESYPPYCIYEEFCEKQFDYAGNKYCEDLIIK